GDEVILLDARHYTGAGSRAVLNLNGRGASLGALVFDWEQTNYFNDRDRYLYQALAQQIAAVMDSIQLFEQINLRAERAERRLRVNGALSQATDELQILAALAEYPQLHRADWLTLAYLDVVNTALLLEPIAYYSEGEPQYWQGVITQVVDGCSLDDLWVQQPDQVALIENIAADIRIPPAERTQHLAQKKTRALALVPLFSNGRYQGVLYVAWFQPHLFSEDEKYVFEEVRQSLPAFIASRRAYLAQEKTRQETEQRAHELAAIAQISALISSILDEDLLLEKVAEVTRASFPHYLMLIYLLVDGWLVRIAPQQHVYPDDDPSTYRLPMFLETSLMVRAAQTRQILVVDDIPNNTQYRLLPLMVGARSEMVVPILAGDEVVGVVDVQCQAVGHFADPDARVVQTLVDMIAVAIQNARLYRQARQLAVSEERNRLARELHDSVSQALYGIVLGANTAQTLLQEKRYDQLEGAVTYVLSLAKAGLDEIRASIFDLRPVVLQDQGLIQAITSQVNALQIRHGIEVNLELCSEPDLPFQIKEEIYRMVREALHNIVKHAQATQVSVMLQNCDTAMELLIVDNGVGFDPARPYTSLGLKSMRERAAALKGTLTIDSTPGGGTRITASLPM
ncbi:MAG TPA: GAF domain-containing sensor histidine kinase, partial [Phototrophicaceae bacterium]|nr:GAF domain-containing sensor histidine kinase [Phototrophicaceae bacterium]